MAARDLDETSPAGSEEAPARRYSGDEVLDWMRTPQARAVASRFLQRRGLGGGSALVEDVLAEAALAMLRRMRSPAALIVESVPAYGTTVIRSVVRQIIRGRDVPLDLSPEPVAASEEQLAPLAGDEVRVHLDRMSPVPAWLSSASLSYLVFLMHPGLVPEHLPAPLAGANPNQARCWPALWLAGEQDLFPEDGADPNRRTRARRIEKVLARVELSFARLRLAAGADLG